jgi:ATP-dependent Clp protease protease subunit
MQNKIPFVIEKNDKDGERAYDLYSRMLKDRIIFVTGDFTQEMADAVVCQLLFLEADNSEKDIFMYVNSPGGDLTALYGIFDTMQYIKPEIVTIGYGQCCSAGSFILAAGTKGKRYALPNTQIMIHELAGGAKGKMHDVASRYEHMKALYEKMAKQYVKMTGQKLNKVKKDMQIDHWLTAEEAKEYGLIDNVEYKREVV